MTDYCEQMCTYSTCSFTMYQYIMLAVIIFFLYHLHTYLYTPLTLNHNP